MPPIYGVEDATKLNIKNAPALKYIFLYIIQYMPIKNAAQFQDMLFPESSIFLNFSS